MTRYRTKVVIVEARQVQDYEVIETNPEVTDYAEYPDWVITWNGYIVVLPNEIFQSLFEPVEEG